jgi:hypothetical protein
MAVGLTETVLSFLEELPPGKHVRSIGQIEAAATSPAQNIAAPPHRHKNYVYCICNRKLIHKKNICRANKRSQ